VGVAAQLLQATTKLQRLWTEANLVHRTRGPAEGKKVYKRLVEHNRKNVEGWYMLGLAEAEDGNRLQSLKDTGRALKLSPDHAESLNNNGVMLTQLKRYEEAREQYQKVVDAFPLHVHAASNLAATLKYLGRTEESTAAKAIAKKTEKTLRSAALGGRREMPRGVERG